MAGRRHGLSGDAPGFPEPAEQSAGNRVHFTAFPFYFRSTRGGRPRGRGWGEAGVQKPAAGDGVDPAGQAGVRGVAVRARPVWKLRRGDGEGGR